MAAYAVPHIRLECPPYTGKVGHSSLISSSRPRANCRLSESVTLRPSLPGSTRVSVRRILSLEIPQWVDEVVV
jgi:hypothetical protein